MGLLCTDDPGKSRLEVERKLHIVVLLLRPFQLPSGGFRWKLTFRAHASADLYLLGRLRPDGSEVQDYYLLAAEDLTKRQHLLDDENSPSLARFRSTDLQQLFWRLAQHPCDHVCPHLSGELNDRWPQETSTPSEIARLGLPRKRT